MAAQPQRPIEEPAALADYQGEDRSVVNHTANRQATATNAPAAARAVGWFGRTQARAVSKKGDQSVTQVCIMRKQKDALICIDFLTAGQFIGFLLRYLS